MYSYYGTEPITDKVLRLHPVVAQGYAIEKKAEFQERNVGIVGACGVHIDNDRPKLLPIALRIDFKAVHQRAEGFDFRTRYMQKASLSERHVWPAWNW